MHKAQRLYPVVTGVAILLLFLFSCPDMPAQESRSCELRIVLNGEILKEPGLYYGDYAYVPLKAIADALGVPFCLDESKKIFTLNGITVRGKALKKGGVIYISVLSVAENTDSLVKCDVAQKTITITYAKSLRESPSPAPSPMPTASPEPAASSEPTASPEPAASPSPVASPVPAPFLPVTADNGVFRVTISNVNQLNSCRSYVPRTGNKFVLVRLSQQNISTILQIYTGVFTLVDCSGHVYNYIDTLSNFWLLVLKPGGINFGYIVFEIPQSETPARVVLSGISKQPLTLNLQ